MVAIWVTILFKFRYIYLALWELMGFLIVMLSATKHPRGTGFFTAFRMTRTPANHKAPFILVAPGLLKM
jgi:hypothetical protein